jgi:hypothetical protein
MSDVPTSWLVIGAGLYLLLPEWASATVFIVVGLLCACLTAMGYRSAD